jgi:hypothetical protein
MCAIVNMINTTLNIDYKEVLQTMLAEYSAGKGPTGDHRTDYMVLTYSPALIDVHNNRPTSRLLPLDRTE